MIRISFVKKKCHRVALDIPPLFSVFFLFFLFERLPPSIAGEGKQI